MRWLILSCCFFLSLTSCSSPGQGRHGTFRIGIDSSWAPLNFDNQQPYVNGYTEDLLLEIARYNGIAFERISANSDSLLEGLKQGQYDAVLTSMPPFEYNTARYDFSQNFLNTGLVLIVGENSKNNSLKDLSNQLVGILPGSPAALILEQNGSIIIRSYPSIPNILNALLNEEIKAAVLDRLPAAAYVRDLYNGKLKIVGAPLTNTGLHAVAPKDSGRFIAMFNRAVDKFKKKRTLDTLEKKWQLQ